MTLLILDFRVPDLAGPALSHALFEYFLALWPKFVCYAMSFLILGVLWIGHHNQFHFIQRSDRFLLWINLAFLMAIAFIPFSTAFLGRYWSERLALTLYGGNVALGGVILYAHWRYATARGLSDLADAVAVRLIGGRILIGVAANLLAIAIGEFRPEWSLFIYVAILFIYIIPGRVDRYWKVQKP
jgi:uncharacterized membrane protein